MGYKVSHGRNRKRKAGRTGRTKLAVQKRHHIKNFNVRENWDHKKTVRQNMAKMGLPADVNNMNSNAVSPGTNASSVVQLFDIPNSDNLKPKQEKLPLTEEEQKYIAKCLAKHGDNYKKMAFDLKVNKMQHTEHILRKMGSRFILLESHQRSHGIEIPDKVKHLISS